MNPESEEVIKLTYPVLLLEESSGSRPSNSELSGTVHEIPSEMLFRSVAELLREGATAYKKPRLQRHRIDTLIHCATRVVFSFPLLHSRASFPSHVYFKITGF